MSIESEKLHIFFFPFMAQGHMIPAIDMAKLFASRGVKATLIITASNAPPLSDTIRHSQDAGEDIQIRTVDFPSLAVGLPDGVDKLDRITNSSSTKVSARAGRIRFFQATAMLQGPLELLLQELNPDCLVADMFFPWATDAAAKFGIPRLVFHGSGFFPSCASQCTRLYQPYKNVESDSEPFFITNLPGDIQLTKKQVPEFWLMDEETEFTKTVKAAQESELTSYGVVMNSFYELEPVYADYYRNVLGRRAWHVGPICLYNRNKTERDMKSSIDDHECLNWLDSKEPDSVVYICFGSIAKFTGAQLKEIAFGLEAAGQNFILVVRTQAVEETEEWLPEGFEQRTEGKGLIIRGWAPQVLILDHPAVGGFVTHCGWNSVLEGISSGVPLVAWPVMAEQFYNEKFLTKVLGIAVSVGVKKWTSGTGDFVSREQVEKGVTEIMIGEKAREMRSRAKELAEMAKMAVEDGGSSSTDLNNLLQELSSRRH